MPRFTKYRQLYRVFTQFSFIVVAGCFDTSLPDRPDDEAVTVGAGGAGDKGGGGDRNTGGSGGKGMVGGTGGGGDGKKTSIPGGGGIETKSDGSGGLSVSNGSGGDDSKNGSGGTSATVTPATNTASAGGTSAGVAGATTVSNTVPKNTCPDGFSCVSNSTLDSFIKGATFCSNTADSMPPACTTANGKDECKAMGLPNATCTNIIIAKACLMLGCTKAL
jgi:hypothetical protein